MILFDIGGDETEETVSSDVSAGFASVKRKKVEREYIHAWIIWYFYVILLTQIISVLVLTVSDFGIEANSASLESSVTEDKFSKYFIKQKV